MLRRFRMRPSQTAMVFLVTFSLAGTLLAGGFWLEFGNPKASSDPKAKEAVVTVRPTGCGEPAKASVAATAEGLVDGRRQSIPLKLVALSQPGLYAVPQSWPQSGTWAVAVSGVYEGRETGAIAPVSPKGIERQYAKFVPHKPTGEEIDSVLQSFAGPRASASRNR